MLSQVAQFAPEYDVVLQEANVDLRASFDSSSKYGLSDASTAFQKMSIRIVVKSSSPVEQVQRLITHAERGCHAARSMREPVPVLIEAVVNGETLAM
jgi:organic hydroperoxide reductase OsmC/OhrA